MKTRDYIRLICFGICTLQVVNLWGQQGGNKMEYVFHDKGMTLATADDFEDVHSFDFEWGAASQEKKYLIQDRGEAYPLKDQPYKTQWEEFSPFELKELYPNIHMRVRPDPKRTGKLYVEFEVLPGGDPQDIEFDFHRSPFISDKGGAVKVDNLMGSLQFSDTQATQVIEKFHPRDIEAELFVQESVLKVFVGPYEQDLPLKLTFEISFLSQFQTDI